MVSLLDPLQGGKRLTSPGDASLPGRDRPVVAMRSLIGNRRTHVREDDSVRAFAALLQAGQTDRRSRRRVHSHSDQYPIGELLSPSLAQGNTSPFRAMRPYGLNLGAGNVRNACFACSMQARDRRDTGAREKLSREENAVVKREKCAQVTKRLENARKRPA